MSNLLAHTLIYLFKCGTDYYAEKEIERLNHERNEREMARTERKSLCDEYAENIKFNSGDIGVD